MNPKVSIITITHEGREKYLPEVLQSIQNQTFTDWEFIVVDNDLTSNTENILKNDSNLNGKLQYIKNEQDPGISQARNQGLKTAQSEYIAILDSDDLWIDKEKLAKQVAYLDTNQDCAAVGTGVIVIDEHGLELSRYQNETDSKKIKNNLLIKNLIAHSSVMYRKTTAQHVGGYDENLPFLEDYDLWLKMGSIWKLANLEGFMTKYRKHSGGVTKQKILAMMKMNIKLILKYRKDYPNFYQAYIRRVIRYMIKLLQPKAACPPLEESA